MCEDINKSQAEGGSEQDRTWASRSGIHKAGDLYRGSIACRGHPGSGVWKLGVSFMPRSCMVCGDTIRQSVTQHVWI